MKKLLFFLIASLPFACSDDDGKDLSKNADVDYDYVIFGDYYGECAGDCVHIYKLSADKLYAIENGPYPHGTQTYPGKYTQLSTALYEEVKNLPNGIPYETLKNSDTTIGEPDAGDSGGIYLEVSVDGERDYWFLDKKEDNLPNNLKSLVDDINEKLAVLKAAGD